MEKDRKELNLVDVFSLIGKGISHIFLWCMHTFGRCLRLFFRHRGVTLACLLGGLGCGLALFFCTTPYQSGFVLASPTRNIYHAIQETEEMTRHCRKGDLAPYLGIEDSIAAQVKAINAYYVVDRWLDNILDFVDYKEKYGEDTLVNTWSPTRFYVEVLTTSEEIVPELREAIVKKMCQNRVIQTTWTTAVNSQKQWIRSYEYDLARLDSVQNIMYSAKNLTSNLSARIASDRLQFISENRVQVFSQERQYLLNNLASSERYLDELGTTPIYASTPVHYDGKSPSLFKQVALFGILGLLLALLISVFIEKKDTVSGFLRG